MPALANTTRAIARSWTKHSLPVARAGCTAMQTRNASDTSSSFDSPFRGASNTTKIPSFGAYKGKNKSEEGPKLISYFMVGTMGALASLGAKATVQGNYPHKLSRGREAIGIGKNKLGFDAGEQLAILRMDWTSRRWQKSMLTNLRRRLPRQHVRFRRCLGPGQG